MRAPIKIVPVGDFAQKVGSHPWAAQAGVCPDQIGAGGLGVSPESLFITPFLARKGDRGMVETDSRGKGNASGRSSFLCKAPVGVKRGNGRLTGLEV